METCIEFSRHSLIQAMVGQMDEEGALFDDLTGASREAPREPPTAEEAATVAMLQVIEGDSTLRHVKELIFEYNQSLIELGVDVGSFQVSLARHGAARLNLYFGACCHAIPHVLIIWGTHNTSPPPPL